MVSDGLNRAGFAAVMAGHQEVDVTQYQQTYEYTEDEGDKPRFLS